MKSTIIALLIASSCIARAESDLEKRVTRLEQEVAALKAALEPTMKRVSLEQVVEERRTQAKERMREDLKVYSRDQLREIESLYQVANKQWRSEAGKESLKKLIANYKQANRTGCALLYLGQMSEGDQRETYLKQAIEGFSDCFYGDGVQVGAYARYQLAHHYKNAGETEKAKDFFDQVTKTFPGAIDHKGRLLSTLIERQ